MNKTVSVAALALALAVSGAAFAQSPTGVTPLSPPVAATPQKVTAPQRADQSALTIEKLTQDLQKAGFSDVKILEDAFLVQAKTKDGNPILMTIGPHGMSALEFSKVNGTEQDRAPPPSDNSSTLAPKPTQQR
jgi:hypothetical protein